MSDRFMDQFIADLVKGAAQARGFAGGPVNVVVARNARGHEEKLASADGVIDQRYAEGIKAAAARFGIKEALLPALLPLAGSLFGGSALRAGAGALAKRFGGNMVGRAAQKVTDFAGKGGWRGGLVDAGGGIAGGMIGSQLAGQQG